MSVNPARIRPLRKILPVLLRRFLAPHSAHEVHANRELIFKKNQS